MAPKSTASAVSMANGNGGCGGVGGRDTVFLIESHKRVDDEMLARESCVRPLSAQWNICWRGLLKIWPYNNSWLVVFHRTLNLHCVHFPREQSLVAGVVATFIDA